MTKVTPEQRQVIADRVAQGESQTALAREYGVTNQRIFQYVHGRSSRRPRKSRMTLNGAVERERILFKMDATHCGGCGQEGQCMPVNQCNSRFPDEMWLCGYCRTMDGWKQSIVA